MYTNDPVSLLSLHQSEHASLVAQATAASGRSLQSMRARVANVYYAAVRRAYLRARAARVTASRAAL